MSATYYLDMADIWENNHKEGKISDVGLSKILVYFGTVPDRLKKETYAALEEELKKRGISNEF